MIQKYRILVLGLTSALLVSCAPSMNTIDPISPVAGNNNGAGTGGGATPDTTDWGKVATSMNGKVDGSTFNGKLMIQIDSANQAVIFYLPLPLNLIEFPVQSIDIPQLPGTTIFQVPQPDGSTQLAVRVPLKYILKGTTLTSYNSLPNGDPLPFMPVGENRGFALQLPANANLNLHFYIAANAAAVFIELPQIVLPDPWTLLKIGFPIKNADKTQVVGYFSFVPNRGTFASGVYVAGRIPTQLAVVIDELLKY